MIVTSCYSHSSNSRKQTRGSLTFVSRLDGNRPLNLFDVYLRPVTPHAHRKRLSEHDQSVWS